MPICRWYNLAIILTLYFPQPYNTGDGEMKNNEKSQKSKIPKTQDTLSYLILRDIVRESGGRRSSQNIKRKREGFIISYPR